MPARRRDTSLGRGVYYAPDDYASAGRRVLIFLIDSLVLGLLLLAIVVGWIVIRGRPPIVLTLTILMVTWVYVVACKRSPLRTVGYWLWDCRLVDLQGRTPSLFSLTVRSLLWMFGPFNLLFDLLWCGIDDDRQTLRDRFAQTCLIRNGAVPIGEGEVHLTYFDIGSFNLTYPRVVHPKLDRAAGILVAERVN